MDIGRGNKTKKLFDINYDPDLEKRDLPPKIP